MKPKKMMLNLSCGHVVILDKMQAAQSMRSESGGNFGTAFNCPKCHVAAPPRRVVERSWIADGKE